MDEANDFYSDSDSISFNSLSRSSSLIQFESLERQMQGGVIAANDNNSFGGSTPSLYSMQSYDLTDNVSKCEKRCESSESKLSRNYYDLDKIDFNNTLFLHGPPNVQRSDSSDETSSSENSIFSETRCSDDTDETILKQHTPPIELRKRAAATASLPSSAAAVTYRCKNSVENLSEDSGYGEYNSMKIRSKSIPNFQHDHHFIEEEEFENHKSLEDMMLMTSSLSSAPAPASTSSSYVHQLDEIHSAVDYKTNKRGADNKFSAVTLKIASPKRYSSSFTGARDTDDDAKNMIVNYNHRRKAATASLTLASSSPSSTQNISASLPDILDHVGAFGERNYSAILKNVNGNAKSSSQCFADSVYDKDFSIVSSVPSGLNICVSRSGSYSNDCDSWNLGNTLSGSSVAKNTQPSVAIKNFDLYDFETNYVPLSESPQRQQKVINASYSNLTVLDYSGRQFWSDFRKMADNRKRSSGDFSKCNFLLDEISAHFDRDLSILNDQKENYDPVAKFIQHEASPIPPPLPPLPPPRKFHSQNKVQPTAMVSQPPSHPAPIFVETRGTFDRDPTNLITSYAESLERCNFDLNESTNSLSSNKNLDTLSPQHSAHLKRQLVSSTPNLCLYNPEEDSDNFLQVSSTHTSMNPLPNKQQTQQQSPLVGKIQGILTEGSRNSLGKGVSFCPIVSEISWREQSSEEYVDDEDDDEEDDYDEDDEYDDEDGRDDKYRYLCLELIVYFM